MPDSGSSSLSEPDSDEFVSDGPDDVVEARCFFRAPTEAYSVNKVLSISRSRSSLKRPEMVKDRRLSTPRSAHRTPSLKLRLIAVNFLPSAKQPLKTKRRGSASAI